MKRACCFIFLALGGCASQVGAVRAAVDEAPAWFQDRREEIRGEEYPDIAAVPAVAQEERPRLGDESGVLAEAGTPEDFLDNPRAQPPNISPAQIMAWARSRQALFAGIAPPGPDTVIAPDTSVFDVPRGQPPASPR